MKKLLGSVCKRFKKNKGMSLVELLLAIVILGLVAAPILQFIFSSMTLNLKSRRLLACADVGQHVMESITAKTYDDCLKYQLFENNDKDGNAYSSTNPFFINTGNKSDYTIARLDEGDSTLAAFKSSLSTSTTGGCWILYSDFSDGSQGCCLTNFPYEGETYDVLVVIEPNPDISGDVTVRNVNVQVFDYKDGDAKTYNDPQVSINGVIYDHY